MKIHTPIFILGLLVFVTPFLGFPSGIQMMLISAFGIAIMVISATIDKIPDFISEDEENAEVVEDPSYEELSNEVQESHDEVEDSQSPEELENEEKPEN